MAEVTFVPDPAAWEHAFHSWEGMVGQDIDRRLRIGHGLIREGAPAPGKPPNNRTGINYATGRLYLSILMTHARWGNDLEGRIIALPEYVLYLHYGTKPHVIVPVKHKFLKFRSKRTGDWVYTKKVNHPGTRANTFMTDHLRVLAKM